MQTALVIGGTGPTGPGVVKGLTERGYEVSIAHSGQHEVEFKHPVEHLHGDVHFEETFAPLLKGRDFDLVIAMYGRHRVSAKLLKGRTGRVIAVSGFTGYASPKEGSWGGLGRPPMLGEDGPWADDQDPDGFSRAVHRGEEAIFDGQREGHYSATILRPPIMYGPRAPAPHDWCIVRRILDGRKRILLPDGGLKLEGRIYADNMSRAVLGVVDTPGVSDGQRYNVRDREIYSMRQRVELIAAILGVDLEMVDIPFPFALPAHPLWRYARGHYLPDDNQFRVDISCADPETPAEDAIRATVAWLIANRAAIVEEMEGQLGDPFDYAAEDRVLQSYADLKDVMASWEYELPPIAHPYRHPKKPGERWTRPESDTYSRHVKAMMADS